MGNSLVIDASVVLEWIETADSPNRTKAIQLYKLLKTGEITAYSPLFLLIEVINVLYWKKKRSLGEIQEFINRIKSTGINFIGDFLPEVVDDLLEIMEKYELTSYDAQYVNLALKKGLKLATFDGKLAQIQEISFG